MLQFTPAYFFSDEPNLAKKNCSYERVLIMYGASMGRRKERLFGVSSAVSHDQDDRLIWWNLQNFLQNQKVDGIELCLLP